MDLESLDSYSMLLENLGASCWFISERNMLSANLPPAKATVINAEYAVTYSLLVLC